MNQINSNLNDKIPSSSLYKRPISESTVDSNLEKNFIHSKLKDIYLQLENLLNKGIFKQEKEYCDYPKLLQGGELKEHQISGVNWIFKLYKQNINCIWADEMGMGKTIQSIAFLAFLKEKLNINKFHLIVVPKSTLSNWEKEFSKWFPDLRIINLIATKEHREEILKNYIKKKKFDVILTTYEGVNICLNSINRIKFESIIIDEAHKLKNNSSIIHTNLKKLKTKFKLLLTGTPLQNNIEELFNLLSFIMPNIFNDFEFFEKVKLYLEKNNDKEKNEDISKLLNEIIDIIILRRTKNELEFKLPEKKEMYLFCKLTKIQNEIYKKILIKENFNGENNFNNVLMQLKKCCNHPYLFDNIEEEGLPEYGDHLYLTCGKMIVLDKLLDKFKNKNQVLIFCSMTKVLDIIEDYCVYKDYEFCRIDGKIGSDQREKDIKEFTSENSKKFIFLLSTRSGGLGLNLFSANIVILYDSDYNPQVDKQAMDRAHRIGQKKDVLIYRLLVENSVEEKIMERQIVKLNWNNLFIEKNLTKKEEKIQLKNTIIHGAEKLFNEEDFNNDYDLDYILKKSNKIRNEKFDFNQNEFKLNTINVFNFENKDFAEIRKNREIKLKEETQRRKSLKIKRIFNNRPNKIKIEIYKFNFYENFEKLKQILKKENKQYLSEEEIEEKKYLLSTGYSLTKKEFFKICKGMELFGKKKFDKIADYVDKDIENVKEYIDVFFSRYKELDNGEKIMNNIIKKEEIRENFKKIQKLMKKKCKFLENPNLTFFDISFDEKIYSKYKNKLINDDYFDKFLIFKFQKYGLKKIHLILNDMKKEEIFRYNIFYQNYEKFLIKNRIKTLGNIIDLENEEKEKLEEKEKEKIKIKKKKNKNKNKNKNKKKK